MRRGSQLVWVNAAATEGYVRWADMASHPDLRKLPVRCICRLVTDTKAYSREVP
jgi:hypothetical protein